MSVRISGASGRFFDSEAVWGKDRVSVPRREARREARSQPTSGAGVTIGRERQESRIRALLTPLSWKCEAEMKRHRVISGARLLGSKSVLLGHRMKLRNLAG